MSGSKKGGLLGLGGGMNSRSAILVFITDQSVDIVYIKFILIHSIKVTH